MIKGLDSSSVPNASQVAQAKAAGYKIWSGYLQTKPNVNIYHAWTEADFDIARQCGSKPIAYCSGWDDPVACKNLAAQWDVLLCLDVESSIRADGSWVQGWLDASGAGLYGNSPVFAARRAPFYVLAAYPGYDPGTTWPGNVALPPGPHGWQYQGTHSLFGIGVDTTNFDDWFVQSSPPQQDEETQMFIAVVQGTPAQFLVTDSVIVGIDSGPDSAALQAAGIKQTSPMSAAQWKGIQDAYALNASSGAANGTVTGSGTINLTVK